MATRSAVCKVCGQGTAKGFDVCLKCLKGHQRSFDGRSYRARGKAWSKLLEGAK